MPMRIAAVICSIDRPAAISRVLPAIKRQSKAPTTVLLVVTRPKDLPQNLARDHPDVQVVFSDKGLPKQRNCGLDYVQDDCDAVFFIDDDYLPASDALAGIERSFAAFPDASGLSGHLLADGINGRGLSFKEAETLIEHDEQGRVSAGPKPITATKNEVGLYGCNMAYRTKAIGALRFDERLPLYGWQEDVDFASRLPGEKLTSDAVIGVHCGVKSGRETSGQMLGYSQIANVFYLVRKGSLPRRFGARLMMCNVLANHTKILRSEAWIDRRARARGNRIAIWDVIVGRATPERILEL
ncbi:family 2 glycosyl transferase [Sulfitobacter sp. SK012]|uniref:glycosyltransferase family 2 protein n=1 Tax=Sulfitobacter sp. SK012 TaxID=1389005 RepID=UPI000E0A69C1|nr:glycosyltransferase [Sulfitobacter sp. SK012]AXI46694.1 family 2 glycosyl transferase [Sulfitobacter sp. SK012]